MQHESRIRPCTPVGLCEYHPANHVDYEYLRLLHHVMSTGLPRGDRTGTGTFSVFGAQMRHDMSLGFPLITTKKVFSRGSIAEFCWMIRGNTNTKFLQDRNVHIWDEWAKENGELGPIYGKQWRCWQGARSADGETRVFAIDQIARLVHDLGTEPFSRRHVVSAWNTTDVDDMSLPPCHTLFQCYVREDLLRGEAKLDLQVYCRSIDIFLGLPFDLSLYGMLLSTLARLSGYTPGELVVTFGDLHLYNNHWQQGMEQLQRMPMPQLPTMELSPAIQTVEDLDFIDLEYWCLKDYQSHPVIKAGISV